MKQDSISLPKNVVPFVPKRNEVPSLKEILKDKEVADFYRFIAKHDGFREKAIELLSARLERRGF